MMRGVGVGGVSFKFQPLVMDCVDGDESSGEGDEM